jgi:hypothetical protein
LRSALKILRNISENKGENRKRRDPKNLQILLAYGAGKSFFKMNVKKIGVREIRQNSV